MVAKQRLTLVYFYNLKLVNKDNNFSIKKASITYKYFLSMTKKRQAAITLSLFLIIY